MRQIMRAPTPRLAPIQTIANEYQDMDCKRCPRMKVPTPPEGSEFIVALRAQQEDLALRYTKSKASRFQMGCHIIQPIAASQAIVATLAKPQNAIGKSRSFSFLGLADEMLCSAAPSDIRAILFERGHTGRGSNRQIRAAINPTGQP